jgi:hypothetical protein
MCSDLHISHPIPEGYFGLGHCADNVYILRKGTIVFEGSPEQFSEDEFGKEAVGCYHLRRFISLVRGG